MRLSVIGTGYLGAVHAACMVKLGHEVIGVDADPDRVHSLAAGKTPFYEPGLDELLAEVLETGRLSFSESIADAVAFADTHFICVGTPQAPTSNAADLKYVDAAADQLGPLLDRPSTVIGKSTVPVGTAARLQERIRALAPAGDQVSVVWNPEFLREGFAIADTLHPNRLVAGTDSESAAQLIRDIYAPLLDANTPLIITDFATSELVKVAANAFLATKISFINAMAEVCEATGADVTQLAEAIGHDDRIGKRFLRAGLGFGGGCLPKDIRAFMARAGELGLDQSLAFLRDVDEINLRRRSHTVDLARQALGGRVKGKAVACLGAAFKPDSDDVRDSPALDVAAALQVEGAQMRVFDPKAAENGTRQYPTLQFCGTAEDALAGADLVMLLTEWDQFRRLDPEAVGKIVAVRRIIDARNVLDPAAWRAAGWQFKALGRP